MTSEHWKHLNGMQLGKYAEYLVKMEFLKHGIDVFTAEVDDKGIDMVIRIDKNTFHDIQVKSSRKFNYIFMAKSKFELRENLYAAIVLFNDKSPDFFLIPSTEWKIPNALLRDRDYEGKKSAPEYGINLSKKNLTILETYRFETIISQLL